MRSIKLAVLAVSMATSLAANAYTITNTNGGNGFVTGSFPSFTINGSDGASGNNYTKYSDTTATGGQLSFSWSYSTNDWGGPGFDPAGYFVNTTFTQLSPASSGSVNLSLVSNDLFGWYVYTTDGCCGKGILNVSASFTPTTQVPEPASIALLGLGLAGVAFARRKKQQ